MNARIIRIVEEVGRSPGGEEVVGHRNSDRAGAKGHVEIVFVRPTIADGPSARFSGAFTTPITREDYDRDPPAVSKRADAYLK